ncbi:MAG TPA: TVP38/TMEM64 family protein [Micropepsaceae bacterium]|nr:TVP38/TMEM64 family protein [Micropepsaceae bacterium]
MSTPENESVDARLKRALPFVALVAGLIVFFALDLQKYFTLESLRANRVVLADYVAQNPLLAPLAFGGLYALVVAFSLPLGAVMTLAGGLLFGLTVGTVTVVCGATLGATALFLAARGAFRESFARRAGATLKKLEAGFQRNAFSYLLTLRLIPAFPFFLVNLAPALLGMRLGPYVLATFIGIIPGTFVYISIGNGLGALFDAGQTPELGLSIFLKPEILLPIGGLILLSLLPIAARRFGLVKNQD